MLERSLSLNASSTSFLKISDVWTAPLVRNRVALTNSHTVYVFSHSLFSKNLAFLSNPAFTSSEPDNLSIVIRNMHKNYINIALHPQTSYSTKRLSFSCTKVAYHGIFNYKLPLKHNFFISSWSR